MLILDLKNIYYRAGISTIDPIVYEIFNNTIPWRPFLKMAATAHLGTFTVASISEMFCIGMIIMCAKRHRFTTICTIFMLSAGLGGVILVCQKKLLILSRMHLHAETYQFTKTTYLMTSRKHPQRRQISLPKQRIIGVGKRKIRAKAVGNSGKSNGNFGQKQ